MIGNLGVEITSVGVVHDDAETALVHEGFLVGDDVRVAHGFQNVHLSVVRTNETSLVIMLAMRAKLLRIEARRSD